MFLRIKFFVLFLLFTYINSGVLFSQSENNYSVTPEQEKENAAIISQLNDTKYLQDSAGFFSLIAKHYVKSHEKKSAMVLNAIYSNLGKYYYYKSKYKTATAYFDSASVLAKEYDFKGNLAVSLMNSGACHYSLQHYSKALRDYLACERILTKINSERLGGLMGNISSLYLEIGDMQSAKTYLNKSLPFLKLTKDYDGMGKLYNNLGLIYKKENNVFSADSVFRAGLVFSKKYNLKINENDMLFNLVELLSDAKKYKEAAVLCPELYTSTKKLGDESWLKLVDLKLATVHFNLKNSNEAEKYLNEAESLKWSNETAEGLKVDYFTASAGIYFNLKKYQKSAEAFTQGFSIEKNYLKENNLSDVQLLKFKYEKQQDSLALSKQKEIDDLYQQNIEEQTNNKLRRQMFFIWVAVIGLLVVVIFSLFLIKAIRTKEKANKEILAQKKLISEKSEEITASINYAKHIQQSLLPTNVDLNFFLPDHFLIYMPKDIVSGDFYWLKKINEFEFFVAIADCTGHGVPGAIMSALSIQQLNEISDKCHEPSEILGHLNLKIKSNLNQDAIGFSKDGLDICLCKVNTKTKKLVYAGANRSLWIFDKTGLQKDVKPTKAGIAGHTSISQSYAQTEIIVQPEDLILLSTDGFADQFGGEKNKKVTTKLFKEWVAAIYGSADSKQLLESKYLSWKKNVEQIDDVCVLGFKLV